MTNAVATIGLTYRGTDVQEAFGNSAAMFLEIVRGMNESPSVRGSDITVPGRAGRIAGTRVDDVLTVELVGLVQGATGATATTTYHAKVATFRALFDPTVSGSIVATMPDTSTRTLTSCRTVSVVWDEITPFAARVSVVLESIAPDWT
jgi:hypothetical protein